MGRRGEGVGGGGGGRGSSGGDGSGSWRIISRGFEREERGELVWREEGWGRDVV